VRKGDPIRLACLAFLACLLPPALPAEPADLTLWYRQPAEKWVEALPVGNGRLAAMVFGGVPVERIQLNEESLWDGYPRDTTNPEALAALPEVRRLLFEGKNREAERIAQKQMLGRPLRIKSYQTLGDLKLELTPAGAFTGYRRSLDLETGIARTGYELGGIRFEREVFASAPHGVIAIRLAADRPGSINARLTMSREQDATSKSEGENGLVLAGRISTRHHETNEIAGLGFEGRLLALPRGGKLSSEPEALRVEGADELVLLLAAATTFRGGDPAALNRKRLEAAAALPFPKLREEHRADHARFFSRVRLDLGAGPAADLPTDERLRAVKGGAADPGLEALFFQYGRYLLMGSSRPGSLPANLQGKWNEHLNAPWNSDYHTNVNLQMNYWPAEVANLAECHLPLFDYLDSLVPSGERTAKVHYGARGWVVHHLSDIFGFTTPADGVWGVWPVGGAWLARHPWEHYLHGGDREFLAKRAYPLMKGAARFLLDFLVEDPAGRLVTNPSHSPENSFKKADGTVSSFTYGATMDLGVIRDLFTSCQEAAEALSVDQDFSTELSAALKRLAPYQISKATGRLQEWIEDYDEREPGHRHMSHLFGLYPGSSIDLRRTPELAEAARKSLEYRLSHGGGHTGWSRAWIINFYARLEDGEKAHQHLQALLARSTLPNLFDNHPPFQIDGNFGATAGIAEMLLQSHAGELSLLPALPAAWPRGAVRGLRARGGAEVEIRWEEGRAREVTVAASLDRAFPLRFHHGEKVEAVVCDGNQVSCPEKDGMPVLDVRAGKTYRIALSASAKG
jgi:alpha-L-fucosidase 2